MHFKKPRFGGRVGRGVLSHCWRFMESEVTVIPQQPQRNVQSCLSPELKIILAADSREFMCEVLRLKIQHRVGHVVHDINQEKRRSVRK